MKYMGSKSFMLANGLGKLIKRRANHVKRIVDLFSGAAHITWFAAENTSKPVMAVDLQNYSKILANAIIARHAKIDHLTLKNKWLDKAKTKLYKSTIYLNAKKIETQKLTKDIVTKSRIFCKKNSKIGVICRSYGGFYFSPSQAIAIDLLRQNLPKKNPGRSICLAAIIISASKCVAAPGHTAQPFQPTKGGMKYLQEAWNRDLLSLAEDALVNISGRHAEQIGRATVSNALEISKHLKKDDLVIIDPPYSGVQYSRFYHVLETIATGRCGEVTGTGRYPSKRRRPQSNFSKIGRSKKAVEMLLERIARRGAKVIFTFPARETSNGLSGRFIENTAKQWFRVTRKEVYYKMSTMGGDNDNRKARKNSKEFIFSMTPKKSFKIKKNIDI